LLRRSITYTNPFTDEEVTEEHFFHISKADLVQMEMEEHGATYTDKEGKQLSGMQARLQKIVDSNDGKAIIAEIKDFIRRSYGRKEGDRFVKTQAYWDDFASTEAFSQLLFELCTDPAASAEFLTKIIPSNLDQIAAEIRQKAEQTAAAQTAPAQTNGAPAPELVSAPAEPADAGARVLSKQEIIDMDDDELRSGLATGRYKLS
jgi:hypothetical protein